MSKELIKHIEENIQTLTEDGKVLSDKQKRYQAFFLSKLKEYKIGSPSELSEEDKKKFFDEIENGWTEDKN